MQERPTVVDAHDHALAGGDVGDARIRRQRQRRVRGRHRVHVVGLADRRLLAVELAAVPRRDRRVPCSCAASSPARSPGPAPYRAGSRSGAAVPDAAWRPATGPDSAAGPRPVRRPCSTWSTASPASRRGDGAGFCGGVVPHAATSSAHATSAAHCRKSAVKGMLGAQSTIARAPDTMATYLFAWNPALWSWPELPADIRRLKRQGHVDTDWSAGRTRAIEIGSRAFLVRVGVPPKGIFGAGYTLTEPQPAPHWRPEKAALGATTQYLNLRLEALVRAAARHVRRSRDSAVRAFPLGRARVGRARAVDARRRAGGSVGGAARGRDQRRSRGLTTPRPPRLRTCV